MPLLKGKANIGKNISELTHHGTQARSHKQIVAIAMHEAYGNPKHSHPYSTNPGASKKGGCLICGKPYGEHTINVPSTR